MEIYILQLDVFPWHWMFCNLWSCQAWGWMEWKEGNISTARKLYQKALSVDSTSENAARCLQVLFCTILMNSEVYGWISSLVIVNKSSRQPPELSNGISVNAYDLIPSCSSRTVFVTVTRLNLVIPWDISFVNRCINKRLGHQ